MAYRWRGEPSAVPRAVRLLLWGAVLGAIVWTVGLWWHAALAAVLVAACSSFGHGAYVDLGREAPGHERLWGWAFDRGDFWSDMGGTAATGLVMTAPLQSRPMTSSMSLAARSTSAEGRSTLFRTGMISRLF